MTIKIYKNYYYTLYYFFIFLIIYTIFNEMYNIFIFFDIFIDFLTFFVYNFNKKYNLYVDFDYVLYRLFTKKIYIKRMLKMKQDAKNELFELTNPQKSIWSIEQYFNNTTINNIYGLIYINEIADIKLLKEAIYFYIQKNISSRIRIVLDNDVPKQYISDFYKFDIEVLKTTHELAESLSTDITTSHRFNIIDSDLFLFKIFMFPDGHAAIYTNMHHIISDAWTLSLYITEVTTIYSDLKNNNNIDISLNPSYLDYISSNKNYLTSTKFEKNKKYWNDILNYDFTLATMGNYSNNIHYTQALRKEFKLDSDLLHDFSSFCNKYNVSVFTTLISLFSIYLSKLNNINTTTIGTPILNRSNFAEKHTCR